MKDSKSFPLKEKKRQHGRELYKTKISQKMKSKTLLSIEKNIIE